ncbi:MAG: PQQ-binding-like beta-propeller repeat protein [Planctomycetaceae bacterium]|nr:PQQ-binding-like beta-propeller repeat protein [Planctomycetaceae bacterium]MCB9937602.1 PQQ-binding-like beta-propeller repeat protein [Planctomycetaceae bacterium]
MTAVLGLAFTSSSQLLDAASRKFIAADSSKKRVAIIDENGVTEWEHPIGPLHDLHVLPNGNLLFQSSWTHVVEMEPSSKKIVWQYDAKQSPGNENLKIEIHAFQRLADGNTMVAESGRGRIIEVDAQGKIVKELKLQIDHPHPHRDTRLARRLGNGHYLVCHEGDGVVREYDGNGKVVWDYEVPLFGQEPRDGHGVEAFGNQCFAALRLANGNTLISTGNGHGVIEVTPQQEIVWSLHQNDLPGIQLAWVTTLQVLPSGNIVIGNCHAGPENPQLIEVTRDKKVEWEFQDFERFGNALTNSQILSADGVLIK